MTAYFSLVQLWESSVESCFRRDGFHFSILAFDPLPSPCVSIDFSDSPFDQRELIFRTCSWPFKFSHFSHSVFPPKKNYSARYTPTRRTEPATVAVASDVSKIPTAPRRDLPTTLNSKAFTGFNYVRDCNSGRKCCNLPKLFTSAAEDFSDE